MKRKLSGRTKKKIFRTVILYLLLCMLRSLSACGNTRENLIKELSKSNIRKDSEQTEEESKVEELAKIPYSTTLNAKLMEMYALIWKEYEYVQQYGKYHERIWEKLDELDFGPPVLKEVM